MNKKKSFVSYLVDLFLQVSSIHFEFQEKIENSSLKDYNDKVQATLDELNYITESTDQKVILTLRILLISLQKEERIAKSKAFGTPTTSTQYTIAPYLTEHFKTISQILKQHYAVTIFYFTNEIPKNNKFLRVVKFHSPHCFYISKTNQKGNTTVAPNVKNHIASGLKKV